MCQGYCAAFRGMMARGIERRDIFRDVRDREAFLQRLSEVVTKGEAQLFAWCFMHVYLLLRPHKMPLSGCGLGIRMARQEGWRGSQRISSLCRSRVQVVSQARRTFFLRAHEQTGESMAASGRLCRLAHTCVRQAIEKARMERDEG
jgi:hypothetical protein